jgi:hypothetical protein
VNDLITGGWSKDQPPFFFQDVIRTACHTVDTQKPRKPGTRRRAASLIV